MNDTALPEALNHFATALTASTAASQDLSAAVLASEAARRKRTVLVGLATAAILVMIVLNLVLAVAALNTQASIKDCTDPTGTCARRAQANTATVVASINERDFVATWVVNRCQLGSPTPALFTTCVERDLAAIRAGTLVPPHLPH